MHLYIDTDTCRHLNTVHVPKLFLMSWPSRQMEVPLMPKTSPFLNSEKSAISNILFR